MFRTNKPTRVLLFFVMSFYNYVFSGDFDRQLVPQVTYQTTELHDLVLSFPTYKTYTNSIDSNMTKEEVAFIQQEQVRAKKLREKIIELSQNKAKVNAQDNYGNTALYYAVIQGNKELVELLVDKDSDPNIENVYRLSPVDAFELLQTTTI